METISFLCLAQEGCGLISYVNLLTSRSIRHGPLQYRVNFFPLFSSITGVNSHTYSPSSNFGSFPRYALLDLLTAWAMFSLAHRCAAKMFCCRVLAVGVSWLFGFPNSRSKSVVGSFPKSILYGEGNTGEKIAKIIGGWVPQIKKRIL